MGKLKQPQRRGILTRKDHTRKKSTKKHVTFREPVISGVWIIPARKVVETAPAPVTQFVRRDRKPPQAKQTKPQVKRNLAARNAINKTMKQTRKR